MVIATAMAIAIAMAMLTVMGALPPPPPPQQQQKKKKKKKWLRTHPNAMAAAAAAGSQRRKKKKGNSSSNRPAPRQPQARFAPLRDGLSAEAAAASFRARERAQHSGLNPRLLDPAIRLRRPRAPRGGRPQKEGEPGVGSEQDATRLAAVAARGVAQGRHFRHFLHCGCAGETAAAAGRACAESPVARGSGAPRP
jgi:hypothetical protein